MSDWFGPAVVSARAETVEDEDEDDEDDGYAGYRSPEEGYCSPSQFEEDFAVNDERYGNDVQQEGWFSLHAASSGKDEDDEAEDYEEKEAEEEEQEEEAPRPTRTKRRRRDPRPRVRQAETHKRSPAEFLQQNLGLAGKCAF
jgi:hypothetical protein